MKKKNNLFFKLLLISFLLFMGLYIANESGYYEAKNSKNAYITEENLRAFEQDVLDGKEIDIKDYVTNEYHDYSSFTSKLGQKLSSSLDTIMDGGISNFFELLGNLF